MNDRNSLRSKINHARTDLPTIVREHGGTDAAIVFGEDPANASLAADELGSVLSVLKANGIGVLGLPQAYGVEDTASDIAESGFLIHSALHESETRNNKTMARYAASQLGVSKSDVDVPNEVLEQKALALGFHVERLAFWPERQWDQWGEQLHVAHQATGRGVVALLSPLPAALLADVGEFRTCSGSLAMRGMRVTTIMFAGGREVKPCDLTDVVAEEGASRDLFAIKLDVGEEPAPGSATLYGGGGDYVVHMPDTSTKREMGPFL